MSWNLFKTDKNYREAFLDGCRFGMLGTVFICLIGLVVDALR